MKSILFFVLICFLSFGASLEASPSEVSFKGNTGEILCENVSVGGVEDVVLLEDRWAKRGYSDRNFLNHKLDASDLGIDIEYEEKFILSGGVDRLICVRGASKGAYHGLLLFRGDGENSGVGVWIKVDLVGADVISFGGMSANIIENNSNMVKILYIVFFVLLIVLLILFGVKIGHSS